MKRKLNLNIIKDREKGTILLYEKLLDSKLLKYICDAEMDKELYNLKSIKYRWFHGENIFKKIKNIPSYFSQKRYLHKHGYDIAATWNTDYWFIEIMQDILKEYLKHHVGIKCVDASLPKEKWNEEWEKIINRMIELLELMDESNPIYDFDYTDKPSDENVRKMKENDEKRYAYKDEFFQLFSKWFYYLWD